MVQQELSQRIYGVVGLMRLIAENGLPLKITTQWTDDTYYDNDGYDTIQNIEVSGYIVRINGKKYPRGNVYQDEDTGEFRIDWTYRYTPPEGKTQSGRLTAIRNALKDAGIRVAESQLASVEAK